RRHTEMIVESGRSMMLLLNDILDLSKIEAGQISIDQTPVDLHATLDECLALHRPMAKKKGIKVTLENDGRLEADTGASDAATHEAAVLPTVITDGLRLRQIVLNLIGNAVKFTETGTVRISYHVSETSTTIRVEDTGIGISATRLETIFLPFTQEESSTARRFGGTGLGLSISRQLTELLGGVLDVESEPGVGSTFTLTLPTRRVDPLTAAKQEPVGVDELDMPPGSRILLAEDHDVNRLLAVEMLKRCGQSVAIAHDGNEAISMVIDGIVRERPFDLVLMDVQMPGCDGYSATRAIREEGISPDDLPIIALTANAFPEDVAAARAAGMQAHLAKPLNFAALARALQRWLPTHIVETPMDPKFEAAHWIESEGTEQPDGGLEHRSILAEPEDAATSTLVDLPDGRAQEKADRTSSENTVAHLSPIRSPALLGRWLQRRSETIEAVREALETGALSRVAARTDDKSDPPEQRHLLARRMHKLAGTAAIFGETELGEQAARLELALKEEHSAQAAERLARELLAIADEANEEFAQTADARR
ncbi:MAG: ATP-binding protein, partial [Pseudomonadota bacterium]